MDLITGLKESHEGYCNLAVIICCYSRWVEVCPLRSKEAVEVAAWFDLNILSRFGKPRWIRVDAGGEFEGLFKKVCNLLGIVLRVITPLNPQANG